jgi:hypothetical protein
MEREREGKRGSEGGRKGGVRERLLSIDLRLATRRRPTHTHTHTHTH